MLRSFGVNGYCFQNRVKIKASDRRNFEQMLSLTSISVWCHNNAKQALISSCSALLDRPQIFSITICINLSQSEHQQQSKYL